MKAELGLRESSHVTLFNGQQRRVERAEAAQEGLNQMSNRSNLKGLVTAAIWVLLKQSLTEGTSDLREGAVKKASA